MSVTIDAENSLVLGRDAASISRSANNSPLDTTVFRLLVGLSFWALLGIYVTGFLRPMVIVISIPLLCLFFYGRSLAGAKTYYLPQIIMVLSLIYSVFQRSGPLPGIVLLLQFTSVILFLQLLLLKSLRDLNGALILSLMIILAVAAMNVNFLFPLILVPYVLNFFLVLRWVSLFRHQSAAEKKVKIEITFKDLKRQFAGFIFSAAAFSFMWLVLFYLIPRNESMGLASEASKRRLIGFSDTLSIGESGLLEDNPTVVMRIRPIDEKTTSPSIVRRLKSRQLRGTTYSSYNAGKWSKGRKRRWFSDLRRNSGEVQLITGGFSPRDVHPLEIILENAEPPLVFVPDQTADLFLGLPFIGVEEDRTLFFINRVSGSRRYLANLVLNPLEVRDSPVENITTSRDIVPFLETSGIPQRVINLADLLASGSTTIAERIDRAMAFLQRQCSYSLDQATPGEIDPVEFFLFENKAGSCEHFATALALILRAMRVPARPVSGYTMGDWNDVGKFYTVRQGHAHTWVEVFFPMSGWVPFDPTPVLPEREAGSEVEKLFLTMWETFEGYWFSYVFSFDNRSQSLGFKRIFSAMAEKFNGFFALVVHKEYLVILLLFVFFFGRRLRFMFRKLVGSSSWIPLFYLEWEAHLPINRTPSETPAEFHQRLFKAGIVDACDYANLQIVAELINEAVFKTGSDSKTCLDKASLLLGGIKA